jgi:hypothetical protein
MSRTTQYIGLTLAAIEYANKHSIREEEYEMTTGMFDEPIIGKIYHLPVPAGPNKEFYLKEVVQTSPWSGGPMIFTHLRPILVKERGQVIEVTEDNYFSWVVDPSLGETHTEYDMGTGRYYV